MQSSKDKLIIAQLALIRIKLFASQKGHTELFEMAKQGLKDTFFRREPETITYKHNGIKIKAWVIHEEEVK